MGRTEKIDKIYRALESDMDSGTTKTLEKICNANNIKLQAKKLILSNVISKTQDQDYIMKLNLLLLKLDCELSTTKVSDNPESDQAFNTTLYYPNIHTPDIWGPSAPSTEWPTDISGATSDTESSSNSTP